ncbi:MAG: hypothetical protein M3170_00650 [Candidatus Dormibacteraeota bacterium]|nr:hypothetical protein [Candidatus Dormibacteraeota bacterium]
MPTRASGEEAFCGRIPCHMLLAAMTGVVRLHACLTLVINQAILSNSALAHEALGPLREPEQVA